MRAASKKLSVSQVQHTPQATPAPSRPLTRATSRSDIKDPSHFRVQDDLHRVGDRLVAQAPDIKDRVKYAEHAFAEFRRIQDEISLKLIESGELLDEDHLAFDSKSKMFPDAYDDTPIGSNVALMRVKGNVRRYSASSPLIRYRLRLRLRSIHFGSNQPTQGCCARNETGQKDTLSHLRRVEDGQEGRAGRESKANV